MMDDNAMKVECAKVLVFSTFDFTVMASYTVVEYFAEHERYRCGYCGSSDTNYSHGITVFCVSRIMAYMSFDFNPESKFL